jgi:predicted nucleic acid-binding protein
MIAADTSSVVAYFRGDNGPDVARLDEAMSSGDLALPPAVLTELLSAEASTECVEATLTGLSLLPITPGYWERAGRTRRLLFGLRFKAKVADALIAQACIDNDVALITRDRDFRHFAEHCGLKLA